MATAILLLMFATCYLSVLHMISYCDNKDNIVCRPESLNLKIKTRAYSGNVEI